MLHIQTLKTKNRKALGAAGEKWPITYKTVQMTMYFSAETMEMSWEFSHANVILSSLLHKNVLHGEREINTFSDEGKLNFVASLSIADKTESVLGSGGGQQQKNTDQKES